MRFPYPLLFACSTCSGVPPFRKSLIYKGFSDGVSWNTDSVPACSKVFHVFRFRRIHRAGEMAANPRQPWPAADSGCSTSAPAAGARLNAPARRKAPQRRPGRPRFGTTTGSPSPAGPWAPQRSAAPAPTTEQARAAGARRRVQTGSRPASIERRAALVLLGLALEPATIRTACASSWGAAGLDARPHLVQRLGIPPAGADVRPEQLAPNAAQPAPSEHHAVNPSSAGQRLTAWCRPARCAAGDHPHDTSTRHDRQKAGTRGGKAPALACWPAVRRPAPAKGDTWARERSGAIAGPGGGHA